MLANEVTVEWKLVGQLINAILVLIADVCFCTQRLTIHQKPMQGRT